MTKFSTGANNIINLTPKLKFILERTENIVGKGENAGYQGKGEIAGKKCWEKEKLH